MSLDQLCKVVFECDLLLSKYYITQLQSHLELNAKSNGYGHRTPLQVAVGPLPPSTSSDPTSELRHYARVRAVIACLLILSGARPRRNNSYTHTAAIDTAVASRNSEFVGMRVHNRFLEMEKEGTRTSLPWHERFKISHFKLQKTVMISHLPRLGSYRSIQNLGCGEETFRLPQ